MSWFTKIINKKPEYNITCGKCYWSRLAFHSPRSTLYLAGTNTDVRDDDFCPKCGHDGGWVGPSESYVNVKKKKVKK